MIFGNLDCVSCPSLQPKDHPTPIILVREVIEIRKPSDPIVPGEPSEPSKPRKSSKPRKPRKPSVRWEFRFVGNKETNHKIYYPTLRWYELEEDSPLVMEWKKGRKRKFEETESANTVSNHS
jgi:hypothetical protein